MSIPKKHMEKMLEEVELAPRHAEAAFAWMRVPANGKRSASGILYHTTTPRKTGAWAAIDKNGNRYFRREVAKLIYMFALNEKKNLNLKPPFDGPGVSEPWSSDNFGQVLGKLGIHAKFFPESTDSEANTPITEESMTDSIIENALRLLPQFHQIIFHGPPGTGKTRAAKQVLKRLFRLGEDNDDALQDLQGEKGQWDIVQFHPSYNYEDFVRGVQVETKGNNVAYETVNRAFGDMCLRANRQMQEAKKAKTTPLLYALIIDEINRANVSAVLGELIYGLEYRGKSVKTPYKIKNPNNPEDKGDPTLVIPENLYIIGTMNTADRTIGQIDYAVRRRFAFIACPPDKSAVYKKDGEDVRKIYDKVQALFGKTDNGGFLSSDFDAADVCIGHSYFLPSDKRAKNPLHQIAQKIIWQVVPILHEYIKDGVLQDSEKLQTAIAEIKKAAEDLPKKPLAGESEESDSPASDKNPRNGWRFFHWEKDGKFGLNTPSRTVLAIVKDYVRRNPALLDNLEALQEWFPDSRKNGKHYGIKLLDEVREYKNKFCTHPGEPLRLADGRKVVVTSQWSAAKNIKPWNDFKKAVAADKYKYKIRACCSVNIAAANDSRRRGWDACRKLGFLGAGGINENQHRFADQLENLEDGQIVFAFLRGRGYVGMGEIKGRAVPIRDFFVDETPLLDCALKNGKPYKEQYPEALSTANGEDCEWAVQVDWMKTFSENEAVPGKGNRNVVWKTAMNLDTLKSIKKHFEEAE